MITAAGLESQATSALPVSLTSTSPETLCRSGPQISSVSFFPLSHISWYHRGPSLGRRCFRGLRESGYLVWQKGEW